MSLTSSTDLGGPRTRTRRKLQLPTIEMPAATKDKHYVALRRGTRYHLASTDAVFSKGVVKEVDKETYDWLAEHAVDVLTVQDGEYGRVRKIVRKFQFSPPMDEVVELSYPDME